MEDRAIRLIEDMHSVIDTMEGIKFRLVKLERFGKNMKNGTVSAKYYKNPKKLYVYVHAPKEGTELLWEEGKQKALVKHGGFPRITLHLSLYSSHFLKDNHHPVSNTAFCYFNRIIRHLHQKYNDEVDDMTNYLGIDKHDDLDCHLIEFTNDRYEVLEHIMEEDQKLVELADERNISAYKLWELNRKDYDSKLKKGKTVRITNDYAKKLRMWLCADTKVPRKLEIHDEVGLLQQYEFFEVEVNPEFAPTEFERHHPEYSF